MDFLTDILLFFSSNELYSFFPVISMLWIWQLYIRVLDIIKPIPARRFESLPGGLGVVADDLMAGVYGNIALWLLLVPILGLLP